MQPKTRKCLVPWSLIFGLLVGMAIGCVVVTPRADLSLRGSREEPVFTVKELEMVLEQEEVQALEPETLEPEALEPDAELV
jgi:hypothetical protein